ncbi:MAG: type II toxin-antitoxin system VapC family toxin [Chloroflexi bacterium]|jgi:ribonuclease VapC|nr:type II toxin-antitoxin system VapC family toxin [Chloroflexota bacterium]
MPKPLPQYTLDSYALLAYLQAESGGAAVRALLEAARDQQAVLGLSLINVGEIYYILYRERGKDQAEAALADLHTLPLTLHPVTEERIMAAARLKASFPIAYADAFAAALAQELGALLVTGDPEFESLESQIGIMWLPGK